LNENNFICTKQFLGTFYLPLNPIHNQNKIHKKYLLYILFLIMSKELDFLPYTATSISVVGRFIFMFLIYRNKSTNSLSLLFCILSICSSTMWLYYSIINGDMPMITRSLFEIFLLTISSIYIIKNKIQQTQTQTQIQTQQVSIST